MLFQRMKTMWIGFWSQLIGNGEARHQTIVAQGAIEQHRHHLRSVRDALTNLIFQKKRLGDQLNQLDSELLELKEDVEEAARQDRDDLALNLLARMEAAQEEHTFLKEQVATLEKDIEVARATETQLQREIIQAEQLIGTLSSRFQALHVRKKLQSELQSLTRTLGNKQSNIAAPLKDQIHRLEAEMETLSVKRESWEKDWDALRARRTKGRHEAALRQIKDGMRRREVRLPAVIVAEPVR